ncbi:MAG: phosphoglycerate kinase [Candidatus Magasanikbacteria bacterium]|nr:phosphoglycerate kinase [Candidatus Magasanikbacteria bacterium]
MRFIKEVESIDGKRVLVRVDFNLPIKNKKIVDNSRILASLPTIKYLSENGAKVIIISHLGRPEGKIDENLRLDGVAEEFSGLFGKKIKKFLDYFGEEVKTGIDEMQNGEVVMLENIRFSPDEKDNKGTLAKDLASLADVFVLDAFSVTHRADASVVGIAEFIPSYAGFLIEKELKNLNKVLENPEKPFVVVLGGAKVETKLHLIEGLSNLADLFLVGGAIANSFLKKKGFGVGNSLEVGFENEKIMSLLEEKTIILPVDVVVGKKDGTDFRVVKIEENPHNICLESEGIFDIGPETIKIFANKMQNVKIILWNGAMGYFEQKPYNEGTDKLVKIIVKNSKKGAFSIVGGGETIESIKKLSFEKEIDFISMGGGAMLEYLSGKSLPGLKALQ